MTSDSNRSFDPISYVKSLILLPRRGEASIEDLRYHGTSEGATTLMIQVLTKTSEKHALLR